MSDKNKGKSQPDRRSEDTARTQTGDDLRKNVRKEENTLPDRDNAPKKK